MSDIRTKTILHWREIGKTAVVILTVAFTVGITMWWFSLTSPFWNLGAIAIGSATAQLCMFRWKPCHFEFKWDE